MKRSYQTYRKGSRAIMTTPPKKRVRTTTTTTVPARSRGYLRTGGYYGRYSGSSKASELKFFDTELNFSLDATPEIPIPSLNLIPAGTTESTRVGRKCIIKSIFIRGYFIMQSSSDTSDTTRMIVAQDMQANGAAPQASDLIEIGGTYPVVGNRDLANVSRFKVLNDDFTGHNANVMVASGTLSGPYTTPFKWGMKCNIPLEFSGITGAITELKSNNLFIYASARKDDVTIFQGTCRIRYSDS